MPRHHDKAIRFLNRKDPVLRKVIARVGPCEWKKQGGTFQLIAKSILSQQISVAAARTIRQRLEKQMPGGRINAKGFASLTESQLTEAGISRQKRAYLGDLCEKVLAGEVNFRRLARLSDEHVIRELTAVKGVGLWTAQMFLMFGLGRPDIFAPDDLGLRNAIKSLYGDNADGKQQALEIAEAWSPHRSVASWYLWRSLDLKS